MAHDQAVNLSRFPRLTNSKGDANVRQTKNDRRPTCQLQAKEPTFVASGAEGRDMDVVAQEQGRKQMQGVRSTTRGSKRNGTPALLPTKRAPVPSRPPQPDTLLGTKSSLETGARFTAGLPSHWTCPCCTRQIKRSQKRLHLRSTVVVPGGRKICTYLPEHPHFEENLKARESMRTRSARVANLPDQKASFPFKDRYL